MRTTHSSDLQALLREYLPYRLEGGFLARHIRVNFALLKINISLIVGLRNRF